MFPWQSCVNRLRGKTFIEEKKYKNHTQDDMIVNLPASYLLQLQKAMFLLLGPLIPFNLANDSYQ